MRFSIIVPVRDNARELAACVRSLLEQDCRDMEILLVDQGSTDASPMFCDGFAAAYPERVRVLHQDSGNRNRARNAGLEAARGEYVLFLNRCDLLEHTALACLSQYVDENHADLYLFGSAELDGERLLPGQYRPRRMDGTFTLETHPEAFPAVPDVTMGLWRKRLFDDSGIRFGRSVWYADFDVAMKLLPLCAAVDAVPDRLCLRRKSRRDFIQGPQRNHELMRTLELLQEYFARRGMSQSCQSWFRCIAVEQVLRAAQRIADGGGQRDGLPALAEFLDTAFPGYETDAMLGKDRIAAAQMLKNGQYLRLKLALSRINMG